MEENLESSMLLGVAGAGVEDSPSAHYKSVEDTCVACHMGEIEAIFLSQILQLAGNVMIQSYHLQIAQ